MLSNGKITAPITISNVKECLSESTYNLGKLCTSSKINKWAKYKPVQFTSVTSISDQSRYEVNYGIDVNSAYSLDIASLFTKAASNPDWAYIKPTSYFRLGDFDKYNHKAEQPYRYSFPDSDTTNTSTFSTTFYIRINGNSEINPVTDFAYIDALNKDLFKFGIAYKHKNWSTDQIQFAVGNSLSSNPSTIEIPVTFSEMGEYTILPVITQETGGTSSAAPTIYLPNGYRTYTLTRVYSQALLTISNFSSISWSYSNNLLYQTLSSSTTNLSIVSKDGSTVPQTYGTFTYRVAAYNSSNRYLGEVILNVSDNTGAIDYSGTSTKTFSLDWNYGDGSYNLGDYGIDTQDIYKLIIYPHVYNINGQGSFVFDDTQKWTIYNAE